MNIFNEIEENIIKLLAKEDSIAKERKELLISLADYISQKKKEKKEVSLIFICTHNSRRSTMSQIWAMTAAKYFGIEDIKCYSGGTEATAFNPRAVKAVEASGFEVIKFEKSDNPVYLVSYSDEAKPIKCFSKVYNHSSSPKEDFAAIMTCSDADKNCPIVIGADARFPIRFDDPKEFDGTEFEEIKYKERFEQIGIEMLFVFKNVKIL